MQGTISDALLARQSVRVAMQGTAEPRLARQSVRVALVRPPPEAAYWDGSAYVRAPLLVWDGASFVNAVAVYVWSGTGWVAAI
jgi:hypothetical protein